MYLLCNGDPNFHVLKGMLEKVQRPNWMVHRMEGDHCSFLSHQDGVLRVIDMCVSLIYGA